MRGVKNISVPQKDVAQYTTEDFNDVSNEVVTWLCWLFNMTIFETIEGSLGNTYKIGFEGNEYAHFLLEWYKYNSNTFYLCLYTLYEDIVLSSKGQSNAYGRVLINLYSSSNYYHHIFYIKNELFSGLSGTAYNNTPTYDMGLSSRILIRLVLNNKYVFGKGTSSSDYFYSYDVLEGYSRYALVEGCSLKTVKDYIANSGVDYISKLKMPFNEDAQDLYLITRILNIGYTYKINGVLYTPIYTYSDQFSLLVKLGD